MPGDLLRLLGEGVPARLVRGHNALCPASAGEPPLYSTGGLKPRHLLQAEPLGNELTMEGGGTQQGLRSLCPLEVQVRRVLPGEPDAAMQLDALRCDAVVGGRARSEERR